MQIITSIPEMRRACKAFRFEAARPTLGLVPTMGALHQGHLSLVRASRQTCDRTAATIFVNPLQFAPDEDFSKYPRTFDHDCELLQAEGVDLLFAPSAEEMYPAHAQTFVDISAIGCRLDGASRPGHFRGVATVVSKLFHIVQPDRAFFGQKDAAQVAVLRTMVRDLNFDLEFIVCPTVRDQDGLALSSRNRHLTAAEHRAALNLSRSLRTIERCIAQGKHSIPRLQNCLLHQLRISAGIRLDYTEIVHPDTLEPIADLRSGALIAVAAWVGDTRLIDNILIPAPEASA